MEGILKGLLKWLYGLFIDLLTYSANALLGVMNTDLAFFEKSVPVVLTLYKVFVAVGWGLLIGNLAFQALKIMFSGMGFETEPPAILFLRSFLFGVLLVFSKDICEIGLSLGKNVINLIGVPKNINLSLPEETAFSGTSASWLLVIIIGFILGFQIIKLFFEIAERYVIVGVLTLLCPVGLSMGGSKATKDIAGGYIRTFASAIVMMVMNVLFLKLILSALATTPSGTLVLPWCLLVVGIAKTARKADDLLAKIGMNPARTGDSLGNGGGRMLTYIVARTIMNSISKKSSGKNGSRANNNTSAKGTTKGTTGNRNARTSGAGSSASYSSYSSNNGNNNSYGSTSRQSYAGNTAQNTAHNNSSRFNPNSKANVSQNANQSSNQSTTQSAYNSSRTRFTGNSQNSISNSNKNNISSNINSNGFGKSTVNNNRFGSGNPASFTTLSGKNPSSRKAGSSYGKKQGNTNSNNFKKNRFGSINNPNIKHNRNPLDNVNKQKGNSPVGFTKPRNKKAVVVDIERTEEFLGGGNKDEQ